MQRKHSPRCLFTVVNIDMFDEGEAPVKLSSCYRQKEIVSGKEQKQTFDSFPVIGDFPNDSPWGRMCVTCNR